MPIAEATRIEPEDDRPLVGSWFWVKRDNEDEDDDSDEDSDRYDRGKQWLGCVTEVGSNYAKLKGIRYSTRIALDDMAKRCIAEHEPHAFINAKVNEHRKSVRELAHRLMYCKFCHKTHGVKPGETECSPGAWIDE